MAQNESLRARETYLGWGTHEKGSSLIITLKKGPISSSLASNTHLGAVTAFKDDSGGGPGVLAIVGDAREIVGLTEPKSVRERHIGSGRDKYSLFDPVLEDLGLILHLSLCKSPSGNVSASLSLGELLKGGLERSDQIADTLGQLQSY